MKKKIMKIFLFILIFLILLFLVIKILWIEPFSMSYCLYKEPPDSMDIIYVGGSNVHHHFNSVLAYNKYGFTTGLLSTQSQPFFLIKYCLMESKKYQNQSLYIIDISKVADNIDDITGEKIRKTTDSMKFSKTRTEAINAALSYKKDIEKKEYINYYYSFLMYHNRWKDITLEGIKWNLFGKDVLYKGYQLDKNLASINPQDAYNWIDKVGKLKEENEQILKDLIEYIKANNLNVLFVVPIKTYKEETNQEINDAINIIQENNFKVLNFNTMDIMKEIDFSKDFHDASHLNTYGATKYTLYFAKYLKENYDLKNHKDDQKFKSWNTEYERFKKDFKKITKNSFEELINKE